MKLLLQHIIVFTCLFGLITDLAKANSIENSKNELEQLRELYEEKYYYYVDDPNGCLGDVRTKKDCAYLAGQLTGISDRIAELEDAVRIVEFTKEQEVRKEQSLIIEEQREEERTYRFIFTIFGLVIATGIIFTGLYVKYIRK